MPKIFDNINLHLKTGLLETLDKSYSADFCVGYFNLRGWKLLMNHIDPFTGEENCCRLLVGMQDTDEILLKKGLSDFKKGLLDNQKAKELLTQVTQSYG